MMTLGIMALNVMIQIINKLSISLSIIIHNVMTSSILKLSMMTLYTMTLRLMTLSIMCFRRTTPNFKTSSTVILSIMTFHQHNITQHKDTEHKGIQPNFI